MQKIFREIKTKPLFKLSTHLDYPPHMHEDIELVFVLEGSVCAWCNGEKYELKKNSFFLTFPNQVHHYSGCDLQGKYVLLIVKPSALLGYGEKFFEGVPVSSAVNLNDGDKDKIVHLLHLALEEFSSFGYGTVVCSLLTAFFGKLLPYFPLQNEGSGKSTVLKILKYCSENFRQDITVSSVAENLHLSKSSVSHIFSSRLGMNFCTYINSLRLQYAEQLLAQGNYSITEIATLSGFSTIRSFNRVFGKKHNLTPSKYRKNLLEIDKK